MAFSNNPAYDTRSSVTLPAVNNLDFYAPTQFFTQGLINMIPQKYNPDDSKQEAYAATRPAINSTITVLTTTNSICRGMYVWEKTTGTTYYFVVTDHGGLSSVSTSADGITFTAVNVITSGSTPVRFSEFISSTGVKKLVMVDGTAGWVFTSNAAGTQIVDADFPTPHVPFPVFVDGYLFLAKAGTGDIYNSDLDDPASWTAGNFISSEMYPDDVQALVKVKNFILAIGSQSGEYFYDAGNSPGTPLARYDGATLPFGTSFPNAIACDRDTIMMLAGGSPGGGASFKVIDGFTHTTVPAQGPFVMQGLSLSPTGCRASFFRNQGELFYIFHAAGGDLAAPTAMHCYLYCAKQQLWSAAVITDLRNGVANITSSCWPAYYMHSGSTSFYNYTYVAGHSNNTVFFGRLDDTIGYDAIPGFSGNVNIHQQCIFPRNNYGTASIKTMSRLSIDYERPGEDTTYTEIYVGCLDEGRSSANTDPANTLRTLYGWASPTSYTTAAYPSITQLGSFRSRIISISVPGGLTRLHRAIVDINKGTS